MKKTKLFILFTGILATISLFTNCATLVTANMQSIPVISDPAGAHVAVFAPDKKLLFEGETPCKIILKKKTLIGSTIIISKKEYEKVSIQLNDAIDGCFWGNICIGVFPAIIDIATGNWKRANPPTLIVRLIRQKIVNLNLRGKPHTHGQLSPQPFSPKHTYAENPQAQPQPF